MLLVQGDGLGPRDLLALLEQLVCQEETATQAAPAQPDLWDRRVRPDRRVLRERLGRLERLDRLEPPDSVRPEPAEESAQLAPLELEVLLDLPDCQDRSGLREHPDRPAPVAQRVHQVRRDRLDLLVSPDQPDPPDGRAQQDPVEPSDHPDKPDQLDSSGLLVLLDKLGRREQRVLRGLLERQVQ